MAKKLIKVGFNESRNGIPSRIFFKFREGGARSSFSAYCSKEQADQILEHFPDELKEQ